jgi:tetraacyldisaccharide 4'-kinase
LLREPVANIHRANIVILTRCDQVTATRIDEVSETIRSIDSSILILRSNHRPSGLLEYPEKTRPIADLSGKHVALISGIGNPDAFRRTVRDAGGDIKATKTLPDHADYDRETILDLQAWVSQQQDIDLLVCTQKDLVKLQTDRLAGLPLVALTIEAELETSDEFDTLLHSVLRTNCP